MALAETSIVARWRHAPRRIASFLYYGATGHFYILPTGAAPPPPNVPARVVCYHADAPAPAVVLETIKGGPANWGERWAHGHVCAVAWVQEEPAAFIWLARDGWRLNDGDAPLPLPVDGAWVYDAVTRPAWRGRRLQNAVVGALLEVAAAGGATAIYGIVRDDNLPSQRSLKAQGFRRLDARVRTHRVLMCLRWRSVRTPWASGQDRQAGAHRQIPSNGRAAPR